MLQGWTIVLVSFAYLGVLFAIAFYGDKRADQGRSIIANPFIYALSLGVYATAWTFYGSVGRAASDGLGFLPIYLGPTLVIILWWMILRKIIRISKVNRITSLADFIASRYGKSGALAALVTVIAVLSIVPYISLQLKAVSTSFTILLQYPDVATPQRLAAESVLQDTAFYIAMLLAAFTIAFGTRQLDASERHEGMVAAIAFESLVKLLAFLAVGLFVTFGVYQGFADLFSRAVQEPAIAPLLTPLDGIAGSHASWVWLTILSMLAVMFLPRQFQVAVIENVDEKHLRTAVWLFPLYMLAINIFVLPIAIGGLLHFQGLGVDSDTYVLTLPMAEGQQVLVLFAFIGGLSAATGMVIVETIALSTMVCNDLVMPALLRMRRFRLPQHADLSSMLLNIRRYAIVLIVLLGYVYFRLAGEAYALVSIGLISFAGVAQFAPAILGGLYWKGGTRAGALAGLTAGFMLWAYTLLLPAFSRSGWLPESFLSEGPFGIGLLKPLELFGLSGLDQITHAMIWSMLANLGLYIAVSLWGHQSAVERSQATLFVDIFRQAREPATSWHGTTPAPALQMLVGRFLGQERAAEAFQQFARERGLSSVEELKTDGALIRFAEIQLAGSIGASSARVVISTAVEDEPIGIDGVMNILDEASQVLAYSRQLESKSRELEAATAELRAANERLKELDRMKDDFISTVTHELRTPLTSIRAFSEILHDHPDLETAERQRYLAIVIKETERLTRLINQVLDLSKLESGSADWWPSEIDLREVIEDAVTATSQLFKERRVRLETQLPPAVPPITADRDRLMQVLLNLLSNAAKFCASDTGRVVVELERRADCLQVNVQDNGIGISEADQRIIFEKFRQIGDALVAKPQGSGLGLTISRQIITHFGGRLWVKSRPGEGATFSFTVPLSCGAVAGTVPAGAA
jgi:Na+/proline symporter/nitrogen-specific signal transduction histidine kinase